MVGPDGFLGGEFRAGETRWDWSRNWIAGSKDGDWITDRGE